MRLVCMQLFKKEANSNSTPVEQACVQIVSCLVENVMCLEEHSAEAGVYINHSCAVNRMFIIARPMY